MVSSVVAYTLRREWRGRELMMTSNRENRHLVK